eukprot:2819366-Rhodomonas_salina.1
MRLQKDLDGLRCLILDERSMIGTITFEVLFGWNFFLLRMGMFKGLKSDSEYGGLKMLLIFGDDGQLPPVGARRLFSKKLEIRRNMSSQICIST